MQVEGLRQIMEQHQSIIQSMMDQPVFMANIQAVIDLWEATFRKGGKVLFCGNGGSAADAQHIAAELSGRFYKDRAPLFAEALHVNSSFVTAVANDYGYDQVYARGVQAMGRAGDVLVAISTSGNSPNIIAAAQAAQAQSMAVIAMTGASGGQLSELCDFWIGIPSDDTPRIQEAHILVGHMWCAAIEEKMFF